MTDPILRKSSTREPGNPGEFGTHDHSGPEATLAGPSPLLQSLRANMGSTGRLLAAVQDAHDKATAALLTETLRTEFPGAARAEFVRPWNVDSDDEDKLRLYAIYDVDGNEMAVPDGPAVTRSEANTLIAELGENAGAYFNEGGNPELEEDGEVLTADLTVAPEPTRFGPAEAIGLDDWSDEDATILSRSLDLKTGRIGLLVDKSEAEYRLTEDPEFYQFEPDTMSRLDRKFGGRQAALTAITESVGWTRLEEQLVEIGTTPFNDGLRRVVGKLLA